MYQFKISFIASVLFIATSVRAEIKPYISTETEYNTECKTCPRSLCPNQIAYDYYDKFNVTCWTRGTKIMGDDLWLKSEAGCYVTQYDVIEYAGDYTKDLKYCGPASEVQKLTVEKSQLKYKTECRICPELSCDTMAYLKENTKVDLTCWYPDGQVIIDDPYWLKTTNNCYVAQKNLVSKPNLAKLDNCGPIPFLENLWHNNENGTSDNNRRTSHKEKRSPAPVPIPEPLPKKEAGIGLMYLVNVTVGEEYAPCRSCPQENCKAQRTYEFNNEVWLQCITRGNGTDWWSQTTDFCYVKNSDFWESPEGDYYRMPSCERFESGGPGGDED